jgi:hypothetical protein
VLGHTQSDLFAGALAPIPAPVLARALVNVPEYEADVDPWDPFSGEPPFPETDTKRVPYPSSDGPPRIPRIANSEELRELGREHGAEESAIEQAVLMFDAGMKSKAIRLVLCRLLGRRANCPEGHNFFIAYKCGNRYCRFCMPAVFQALFDELLSRLGPIAERLVPEWPVVGHAPRRVIAKIDFTVPNPGRMATPEEVRLFNRDIRRFFLTLARRMGWRKGDWGAAWCCEFGPGNTNLHAHGVYCGPFIPQKGKEASGLWSEIRGEESFVSVKAARSFQHALRHAVKYPAADWKYFHSTPERMASLEIAFDRARRVHAVGAFYNPPREKEEPESAGLGACPICGSPLGYAMGSAWQSVSDFTRDGIRSLDSARAEAKRTLAFAGEAFGESPP